MMRRGILHSILTDDKVVRRVPFSSFFSYFIWLLTKPQKYFSLFSLSPLSAYRSSSWVNLFTILFFASFDFRARTKRRKNGTQIENLTSDTWEHTIEIWPLIYSSRIANDFQFSIHISNDRINTFEYTVFMNRLFVSVISSCFVDFTVELDNLFFSTFYANRYLFTKAITLFIRWLILDLSRF